MKNNFKIDDIDKRILFELEKNARIPYTKLAKIIKKSKDTVKYRIKCLEQKKIILGYKTWIDMGKLGFRSATIYLSLLNIPKKKEKLIKYIKNNPRSYWIGVAEGVWNIGVTYLIKSNEELFNLKHDLIKKFKDIIFDIKITSLVSVVTHEKNFLVEEKSELITFTEKIEECKIDSISHKILNEIYWDSNFNIVNLANKLNTTIDIIRNRIKDLERKKIIIKYSAVIDYQKIGYEFHKTFVYLKSFDLKFLERLNDYIKNSKIVINLVWQIAPWDLELILFTRNFFEYVLTISDFTNKFSQNIQKIESATMSVDIIFPCNKLPI